MMSHHSTQRFGVIHTSHEFPPADDLPDEALEGIEGNVVCAGELQGAVDHLPGTEEPDVEGRGEDRVEEDAPVGGQGIFVVAEEGEPLFEETVEPTGGGPVGDRVVE